MVTTFSCTLKSLSPHDHHHHHHHHHRHHHHSHIIRSLSLLSPSDPSGPALHALAIKSGLSSLLFHNTLLHFYFKRRDLSSARKLFDNMPVRTAVSYTTAVSGLIASGHLHAAARLFRAMPKRTVVSWTAMIHGFARNGQPLKAFELFHQMREDGFRPNEYTLVGLLLACTELESLSLGRRFHDFFCKNGFKMNVFLGTALINMYSKCGSIEDALKVFNEMPERSVATWNSMITSLGVHGCGSKAVKLFCDMEKANVAPDGITFVGVLCACVSACMVDEACYYFKMMSKKYGIVPTTEHYCCMVELFSRSGMWLDAYELVESTPAKGDVSVWKALQRACEMHGNLELAEVAYWRIVELGSGNGSICCNSAQEQHLYFQWEVN